MSADAVAGSDLVWLANDMRDHERYPQAAAEYARVIPMLRERNHHEALIAAEADLAYVLCRTGELESAEAIYAALCTDASTYMIPIHPLTDQMLKVMLDELRGNVEAAAMRIDACFSDPQLVQSMDDILLLLAHQASVYCNMGYLSFGAATMLDRATRAEIYATKRPSKATGTLVAEMAWDHARFLWNIREKVIEEIESGFEIGDPGDLPEGWLQAVADGFLGLQPGGDVAATVTERFLATLDTMDRWGPVSNRLRMHASMGRVVGLCSLERYDDVPGPALRTAELADVTGDPQLAARMRSLAHDFGPEIEGPGLGG